MLDALGLEHLVDGVGTRRQRRVDVATLVGAHREHVAVGTPHGEWGVRGDGRQRVGDRRQHVVLDLDQFRRGPRLLAGLGDDDRQHVTGERGATSDWDHHRPVLVDDSDAQLARYVGSRVDVHHAIGGCRAGRVNGLDVGAAVCGEVESGVEHAGDTEIVDVPAVAERELLRLVLDARLADPAAQARLEGLALGHRLDGVEDLDVPGAAAQVGSEVRGHRPPIERVALLVDLRLGAHHDPRDAEAALQTAARGEGGGIAVALGVVDSLERRDLATGDLVERLGAADDRLAVDEHRAAAALPRRRTPVLRRRDAELLAQGGEEVGVVAAHRHRYTVERELDAGALDRRHALHSVKSASRNDPGVESH